MAKATVDQSWMDSPELELQDRNRTIAELRQQLEAARAEREADAAMLAELRAAVNPAVQLLRHPGREESHAEFCKIAAYVANGFVLKQQRQELIDRATDKTQSAGLRWLMQELPGWWTTIMSWGDAAAADWLDDVAHCRTEQALNENLERLDGEAT